MAVFILDHGLILVKARGEGGVALLFGQETYCLNTNQEITKDYARNMRMTKNPAEYTSNYWQHANLFQRRAEAKAPQLCWA